MSPLLFVTYLDHYLKKLGLLNHYIRAYPDDLVFVAHKMKELNTIVSKLDQLDKIIPVNKSKSAILSSKEGLFDLDKAQFRDYPIVS
jgi:hypothetical protein